MNLIIQTDKVAESLTLSSFYHCKYTQIVANIQTYYVEITPPGDILTNLASIRSRYVSESNTSYIILAIIFSTKFSRFAAWSPSWSPFFSLPFSFIISDFFISLCHDPIYVRSSTGQHRQGITITATLLLNHIIWKRVILSTSPICARP